MNSVKDTKSPTKYINNDNNYNKFKYTYWKSLMKRILIYWGDLKFERD